MLVSLSMPAGNERGPLYMEQVLAALHQGNPSRLPISLGFTRHDQNVVLFCHFPEKLGPLTEGQLYAQYPDCRLDRLPDDALARPTGFSCFSAGLHLHPDLFPLKRYTQFEDALNRNTADPVTAVLMTLAREKVGRLRASVEIAVRPARPKVRRRALRCLRRLASPFYRAHHWLAHVYLTTALSHHLSLRLFAAALGRLGRQGPAHREESALHVSSGRLHDREEDLQAAGDKLGRLLFEVEIHLNVLAPPEGAGEATRKLQEMAGAFGQFTTPRLASFQTTNPRRFSRFPRLSQHPAFLLSAEELATLWHPPTFTVRAPTMATVESRELEPPATLPTERTHSGLAVLGVTAFRGRRERFGILSDDRLRHLAVLGKTGMGKSTLLHRLIVSDVRAGRGVGLIDPHGDLAEAVLRSIPRERTNEVVLFDAADSAHPVSFNILACPDPAQRPLVASGVVSAFKKLYGDSWGPRLEHILRNSMLTLLEVPGTSLVSLLRLLGDAAYRKSLVGRIRDPVVRIFWEREFAGLHPKLQAEAIAPIQNKVGHFVSSPLLRRLVGQGQNRLDLRKILDDGRVLLVNLSKGRMGEDASTLLGSLLVTGVQLAAMSRADVPEEDRRDFYLYVDEFQNFATDSFATTLSEARKYRLALTLANQYLAQVQEQTLHALFGNAGTLAVFQVGAEDAVLLAEQLGGGVQKEDLLALPRFRAYVRLLVEGMPSRPFSMQTLPPPGGRDDARRAEIIRRYSRQRYARPAARVEEEIRDTFAPG